LSKRLRDYNVGHCPRVHYPTQKTGAKLLASPVSPQGCPLFKTGTVPWAQVRWITLTINGLRRGRSYTETESRDVAGRRNRASSLIFRAACGSRRVLVSEMTIRHDEVADEGEVWVPQGDEECTALRRHLDQVLAGQSFISSRRCPNFLRYVVNETLEGRGDQLKERTVGIELFGREPDYDTNLDHIVRSTATEVRKRLNLYYQENGRNSEIRIDLPQRTYTPLFRRGAEPRRDGNAGLSESEAKPVTRRWTKYAALAAVALFLAGAAVGRFTAPLGKVSAKTERQLPPSLINVLTPKEGQRINAVIGDAVLQMLNTGIAGNFVSLDDYVSGRFLEADSWIAYHPSAQDWKTLQGVGQHEMVLTSRIFQSVPPAQVSVKRPNGFTNRDLQRDNALLIGGPRVNPWVQMFEDNLNFRTDVRAGSRVAEIRNIVPHPGEQDIYSTVPALARRPSRFFGHIAYFPATSSHARVLIVNGPRSGTYTALCFATDPAGLTAILQLFGVKRLDQLPPFEVLLESTGSSDAIAETKIIAFRRGLETPGQKK
jgi:hypothetical protein